MSSKDEKTNALNEICSGLDIFKDIFNENVDFDKVPTVNEFISSAPLTEDVYNHSVQYQSYLSGLNTNLNTENRSSTSFFLGSHSSENSSPQIPPTGIFIGGADCDPNKSFDAGNYSVLSQHLGSNPKSGGSMYISSSEHTPLEIIVPSINLDASSNYTTLNSSIYEELTTTYNLPEILDDQAASNSKSDFCKREKPEVITERMTIKSGVGTEGAIDISNTSEVHQIDTVEQAENASRESDIDISLFRNAEFQDERQITMNNISHILESEPNYLVPDILPINYSSSHLNDYNISDSTESSFRTCPVCGDKATKYTHYGGTSCQSCRAFFRRSAKKYNRKGGFQYFCNCEERCSVRGQPVCVVNKIKRSWCKYCRYIKCKEKARMKEKHVFMRDVLSTGRKKDTPKSNQKKRNNKVDSQERREKCTINIENFHYDHSTIEEKIYDMEKKFNRNFLNDVELIESIKRNINSNTRQLHADTKYILDLALNQEVSLISRWFSDFMDMKARVQLMKQNSATLSKVLLVKMMNNFLAEDESWDSEISAICYILFSSCCRNKNSLNKTEQPCIRILKKMSELVDRGGKIFMFVFSTILFTPTVEANSNNAQIAAHQLHFHNMLKQYLIFQAKGDERLAAVRLGIAVEFIGRISE